MALDYHFGIDFGTTNSSTVGYYRVSGSEKWIRRRFEDEEGLPTPSFVAIDRSTGDIHTGRDAWNRRMELSETCECIRSVKSLLDSGWTKDIAGKRWTAVDVAAQVFLALKRNAFELSEAQIASATVAIPIGFSPKKRQVIRQAAEMAGIEVESFISEPTAAFFANAKQLGASSIVAVFDWGGGTLDVSVIRNENGSITELATGGLFLGGDDLDKQIARKVHAKVARSKGSSISFEDMPLVFQDRMLVKAERAKRILGEEDDASINLNSYGDLGAFREPLTYEWFEAIVEPSVNQALQCLADTIEDSGAGVANVDRVVMVGGTSNLRPLVDRMIELYGDKLFFPEETIWSIGEGAARLSMSPGSYHSAQNLGMVLADGTYYPILTMGESLADWKFRATFGITEKTKEARVVFAGSVDLDKSSDKYWTIQVPQYGFLEEVLKLDAKVDENMVFCVSATSSMRALPKPVLWEYDRLKCFFKISDLEL